MCGDDVDDAFGDRGPHGFTFGVASGASGDYVVAVCVHHRLTDAVEVRNSGLDFHDDVLVDRRGDDRYRIRIGCADIASHLEDGLHSCRQGNALHRSLGEFFQALQAQRQMRAPLGAHECVNLVDDDGVYIGERRTRLRGQQQVQRFRGSDPHIRWVLGLPGAFALRGVAGSHPHRDRIGWRARVAGCDLLQAHQRAAQVAFDVEGERLQRRDVQHPAALINGCVLQAIERGKERRKGLAGSSRCNEHGISTLG